jgi:hypothetical protein
VYAIGDHFFVVGSRAGGRQLLQITASLGFSFQPPLEEAPSMVSWRQSTLFWSQVVLSPTPATVAVGGTIPVAAAVTGLIAFDFSVLGSSL